MQLELPLRTEMDLERDLAGRLGYPVRVVVTDNSSTMMSLRHPTPETPLVLRLHHMFLSADEHVVKALATWVRQPRRRSSGGVLDDFIRQQHHLIRRGRNRAIRVRVQGKHVDLRRLFDEVNERYFDGTVTARITWGRRASGRRRRSMRFGSYAAEDHLIRMHPSLDQDFVPEYFVRYIVFHEMLHAHLGIDEDAETGRHRIHTREFRTREKAYPDYARAVAWQKKPSNLRKLLR